MNNKIKSLILVLAVAAGLNVYAVTQQIPSRTVVTANGVQQADCAYALVNPLDVVARPNFYLNKNIKIKQNSTNFLHSDLITNRL